MTTPAAVSARNFLTLCQDVFREVGAAGVAPTTTVGANGEWLRIVNWVRDAELEIQNLNTDWRWLRKTLSFYTGTQNQTGIFTTLNGAVSAFPTDLAAWDLKNGVWQILPPNNTFFAPLMVYEWETVKNQVFDTTDFAQPWRVIIMPDNTLRFDLIPDQSYQCQTEYRAVPYSIGTSGTPDTDVSNIPARYANQLIVAWAQLKYGMFESAPEQVQRANQLIYGDPGGRAAALASGEAGLLDRLENDQLLNRKKARFSQGNDVIIIAGDDSYYAPTDGFGSEW